MGLVGSPLPSCMENQALFLEKGFYKLAVPAQMGKVRHTSSCPPRAGLGALGRPQAGAAKDMFWLNEGKKATFNVPDLMLCVS